MPFLVGGGSRRARYVAAIVAAAVPASPLHAQEGDPVRGLALLVRVLENPLIGPWLVARLKRDATVPGGSSST